jgi:hypothetical protein
MATTWLAGVGLVAGVLVLAWPALVLVLVPVGIVAWIVNGHLRLRRELRYTPPTPQFEPFPDGEPEPYRVLSTSRRRHTETRRYPDGTTRTIDVRSGERVEDE